MTTTLEIIESSFRLIGVGVDSEDLETGEQNNGLEALQYLLASWADEGITVPHLIWENLSLTSGTESYTVGKNGSPDLDTERPEDVMGAFIRDSSNYDHYIQMISESHYMRIRDKSGASGRPDKLWYKPSVPNGTVYLYPNPNSSADTLHICSLKSMSEPSATSADIVTSVGVPRSMLKALKWNLALELADEYGYPATQTMMRNAMESYNKLVSKNVAKNAGPVELDFYRTRPESGNILNG